MTDQTVTVSLEGQSWQEPLVPAGTIIGRGETCDIVIDSRHISRRHARMLLGSDGQWYVEDLNSSNGTFVNGQRIESCPITVTDIIEIGPASLLLGVQVNHATGPNVETPNIIIEDFGTEVFYDKPRLEDCQCLPCPEQFEKAKRRLSELDRSEGIYPELCRLLAWQPKTAAAVFGVSGAIPSGPGSSAVLAYHFGSRPTEAQYRSANSRYPSHLTFRVSHRLLEAVRKDERPLMSKSIFSCDTKVTVSLIDEHMPRAMMCVPLGRSGQTIDLLYVDVPIDERSGVGPEEFFAFVQAAGHLVCSRDS